MARSWAADALALVRARNLLLSAAGVAIGGVLAQGRATFPAMVWWAMASAACLGAAGNVANDVADREADRLNRPDAPLIGGSVSVAAALALGGVAGGLGLFLAWWVSAELFAIALAALLVMLVYSPLLKRHGLAGNIAVAVVASLPVIYGASAVGWWRAGLAPAAMAALLHFSRELVKDVEDEAGDRAAGRRTLPIVYGSKTALALAVGALGLFVPVSLAPWAAGWYGRRYVVLVTLIDVGVVALAWRLIEQKVEGVRATLKTAMLAGLIALLWDRL
ncbi:MAG: geranylgeranylglycerol-phosphate geranylgeranyltransferase [Gemmatimonadales bacterium]